MTVAEPAIMASPIPTSWKRKTRTASWVQKDDTGSTKLLTSDRAIVLNGHDREEIYSSLKFFNATRTASTTNAVKVQLFPLMAFSTPSITSFGNLIVLFVVGGITGILNLFSTLHTSQYVCISIYNIIALMYAVHLHCDYL
jgi:hypothetical protein